MNNIWILAQTIESEPVTEQPQAQTLAPDANTPMVPRQRKTIGYQQFFFIGVMVLLMYFLLFRGPRKKQQEHKQMVQKLKKNDKVRTIGGIIGTIVDVKGDEITLKVDESNNTKIKVASSAIGKNMSNID